MTPVPNPKIRIRFTKVGKVRFTSHRDVARMWERAFRRTGIPLAYSEGFSPRPKVSFGLALPTGHESDAEFLDVELADAAAAGLELGRTMAELSDALPVGVDAVGCTWLAPRTPSLQEVVASCTWRVLAVAADGCPPPVGDDVAARVDALLAAPSAVVARTRKGTEVVEDIRPGILQVHACEVEEVAGLGGVWLEAELGTRPRGVRPSELLAALGGDLAEGRARRTHQWILRDGARWEPLGVGLPAAATGAPHALEHAS